MKHPRNLTQYIVVLLLWLCSASYADEIIPTDDPASPSVTGVVSSAEDNLQLALLNLLSSSFSDRKIAVDQLGQIADPRAAQVLEALTKRKLSFDKLTDQVLIKSDAGYRNVLSGTLLQKSDIKVGRIKSNNSLRKQAASALAGQQLFSSDLALRLEASEKLIKSPDVKFLPMLTKAALLEDNTPEISQSMKIASAMIALTSGDSLLIQDAAETLKQSSSNQVLGQLKSIDQHELSTDAQLAVAGAIDSIETRKNLFAVSENIFFGLSAASVLLLAAIGLAITFGVMRVINMAHGEMIMLGAYATYTVQQLMPGMIEASIIVAIPVAFCVSALAGIVIERTVIQHLYGRPLETLLATFGVSLILQQAVRSIYGPLNQSVITPEWLSGAWEINGFLSLTYNRLSIIIFSILVLLWLVAIIRYTRFGLEMRAVTQNRPMAASMGIRTKRVDMMAFGLGSGIAGIAGVALSQLTNVGPNLGQAYIIDSFMVVVFGGVGSLLGTFSGAMSLGVANKAIEPMTGAVLAKILILVAIILFIQRRPKGLFALKGRGAEDL